MIKSNEKFPDMKALAEYVHSKGLKIGLYSSPGPKTCAGFEASWQHEEKDAQRTPPGALIISNTTGVPTRTSRTSRCRIVSG